MKIFYTLLCVLISLKVLAGGNTYRPFCFWYWMYGAVTKDAIRADLQTMKDVGLQGCYLMPIRGVDEKPEYVASLPDGKGAQQLTPEFWDMTRYAMQQCDSLGLEMGVHICDGFALAGGPWFTEEESMQKVVWDTQGMTPIAAYAIPMKDTATIVVPKEIIMSPEATSDAKNVVRADKPCWFVCDFGRAVNIRNVEITPSGLNVQGHRLKVEVSNDGVGYAPLSQLEPARQGWQDYICSSTHALPVHEAARYYRFTWTPDGTEPGSEDLDVAKWKATLRLKSIVFHQEPRLHQWEGKAGLAWRVARATAADEIPQEWCVPLKDIVRLDMDKDGNVIGPLPKGNYRIMRMGHITTGMTNATAGGGKGLECDKFSEKAVNKLIDNWFGRFKDMGCRSLRYLHVDSWECGTQNWSRNFAEEFRKRRGYDLLPWLPVMAGVPVESVEQSEKVLRDVRLTINDLIHDVFFATVQRRAHEMGMGFSTEAVAPTMVADGMEHYRYCDYPMGEFWLNSPTHDKPNDMLDAVSGAHVYGKNIVQAEGFTEVRGVWDETPGSIKPLLDRNFCLGMNRLFFHVNTLNPWLDRKPGMTLEGIGLFFQRDQLWMPEAKPFVDYVTRCSALLQYGRPVVDIAVIGGDEMPCRAILPERLIPMLPGIFGEKKVEREARRLANEGQPIETSPVGVNHSANIVDTKDWVNALRGYQYDTYRMGAPLPYRVYVVMNKRPMNPDGVMGEETVAFIDSLRRSGAVVVDKPYSADDFSALGVPRDAELPEGIGYTHRKSDEADIYFLSNQENKETAFVPTFRDGEGTPYIYNAVTNEIMEWDRIGRITLPANGSCFVIFARTDIKEVMSCLPDIPATTLEKNSDIGMRITVAEDVVELSGPYTLEQKEAGATIHLERLCSWPEMSEGNLRYFSGHGIYSTIYRQKGKPTCMETLQLGEVHDIAHVWVNGVDCGIVWTAPYSVKIGHALQKGRNDIRIEVVNTWANALRGADEGKAPYDGIWTNAKYRMKEPYLLPAGLIGPVRVERGNINHR